MKFAVCLGSCVLAATAVAAWGGMREDVAAPNADIATNAIAELSSRIARLEEHFQRTHAVAAAGDSPSRVTVRADQDDVAPSDAAIVATVRKMLADGELMPGKNADSSTTDLEARELRDLLASPVAAMRAILDAGFDSDRAKEIWSAAKENKSTASVLAAFRDVADASPTSTDAQFDLARAALAAAQTDPNHPKGIWWRESDEAFGRVLDLDEGHDQARYKKAVNLCFWPAAFGRQPEAIRHFEKLVAGGATRLEVDDRAQTYVWLGNLYAQKGDLDRAHEVWRDGASRHPEHAKLRSKLADAQR